MTIATAPAITPATLVITDPLLLLLSVPLVGVTDVDSARLVLLDIAGVKPLYITVADMVDATNLSAIEDTADIKVADGDKMLDIFFDKIVDKVVLDILVDNVLETTDTVVDTFEMVVDTADVKVEDTFDVTLTDAPDGKVTDANDVEVVDMDDVKALDDNDGETIAIIDDELVDNANRTYACDLVKIN